MGRDADWRARHSARRRPTSSRTCSTARRYTWRGAWNYVRLDPAERMAHIFVVHRQSELRSMRPGSALVQGRDHLRSPRPRLLRQQRRRHRRLRRPDAEAALPARPRRHLPLAAAVLSLAAPGRRVRHRRLHVDQPDLRDARRLQALPRRGARAGHPRPDRAGHQPHLRSASVVPAGATRAEGLARARLLRVERHRHEVRRHAHHLHRHREVELDVRPGRRPVLLAPLLLAPAGPELRQPGGARGRPRRDALLARHGRRCAAARRHPLSDRARRHDQREPARNARHPQADPPRARRALHRTRAAGRGEPVAVRRARLLRRRRRVPHGVPLPADAAHVHGRCGRRSAIRSSRS